MWDLKSGYWYDLGDIPYPKETKGVLIDSIIYLIGGYKNRKLNYVDTYNISTGEYKTIGRLPLEFERPALAYDGKEIIYILENGAFLTYNIKTNEIVGYLIDINLTAAEMFLQDGKIYILGGFSKDDDPEVVTPSSGLFLLPPEP